MNCHNAQPAGGIRLAAIDLDGTMLDDGKRLSERTVRAVAEAARRGVRIVIASARPPRSVRRFYQHLSLDTLQVNYNGALVWDEPRKAAVFHQPIQAPILRRIVQRARAMQPDVLVSCEILDRWYTDRFDRDFAATFGPQTAREFQPDVIAPVERFIDLDATKLMLLGPESILAPLERMVLGEWAEHVCLVHIDQGLLQIMDRRCSKSAAVAMVAAHYGVEMRQVLAIGDAANDVDMLRAAGIAVAVGNAHPDVRAAAHWIAPSNNDSGVAQAIERFVFTNP